jgi:hypothetical protein
MSRKEFKKITKRQALKRSEGLCEAVGQWYGLEEGQRCEFPLSYGVIFDHIDLDANSKDNSLSNCASICHRCDEHKTNKHDIPLAAKTVRQQDKHNGISRAKKPIPSRPFRQGKGNVKRLEEL